jgi:hypothetical protein
MTGSFLSSTMKVFLSSRFSNTIWALQTFACTHRMDEEKGTANRSFFFFHRQTSGEILIWILIFSSRTQYILPKQSPLLCFITEYTFVWQKKNYFQVIFFM